MDTSLQNIEVDTQTLAALLSPLDLSVRLCAILIKRVNVSNSIQIFSKYLCAGDQSVFDLYQTWYIYRSSLYFILCLRSSSKIFAMANAAGKLGEECSLPVSPLLSSVTGFQFALA